MSPRFPSALGFFTGTPAMLLLATSDAPDRPDASDPEAAPEPAPDEERPAAPERPPEVEPREPEPEIAPHEPTPSEPREPEVVPPETPEIAPPDAPDTPDAPEIAPPGSPEIAPPDAPEITPSTPPEIEPPGSPETVPPGAPEVEPPQRAARSGRPAPALEPPPEAEAKRRPPLQRAALALLIIAAAALIGYVLSRPDGREAGPDALVRSVEAAGQLRLVLETDTPSEARHFVRDEFGWRVGVPVFEAVPLRGVAIAQTAPAVEVPVFLYADAEDRNVAVFAYSYALLDQVPDRLRLTDVDYDDLDDGAPVVRRAEGQDVLLWRDRDDIYVAVTDLPPDALTGGLAIAR